jgi:hypothetical protein
MSELRKLAMEVVESTLRLAKSCGSWPSSGSLVELQKQRCLRKFNKALSDTPLPQSTKAMCDKRAAAKNARIDFPPQLERVQRQKEKGKGKEKKQPAAFKRGQLKNSELNVGF